MLKKQVMSCCNFPKDRLSSVVANALLYANQSSWFHFGKVFFKAKLGGEMKPCINHRIELYQNCCYSLSLSLSLHNNNNTDSIKTNNQRKTCNSENYAWKNQYFVFHILVDHSVASLTRSYKTFFPSFSYFCY